MVHVRRSIVYFTHERNVHTVMLRNCKRSPPVLAQCAVSMIAVQAKEVRESEGFNWYAQVLT